MQLAFDPLPAFSTLTYTIAAFLWGIGITEENFNPVGGLLPILRRTYMTTTAVSIDTARLLFSTAVPQLLQPGTATKDVIESLAIAGSKHDGGSGSKKGTDRIFTRVIPFYVKVPGKLGKLEIGVEFHARVSSTMTLTLHLNWIQVIKRLRLGIGSMVRIECHALNGKFVYVASRAGSVPGLEMP